MTERRKVRIGTRMSKLALIQTDIVVNAITDLELPDLEIEIVSRQSLGDKIQDKPLPSIGGRGVFTEEIEEDLSSFKIDMAVHSMKDLPTTFSRDLVIGCILPREDRRDAVVFRSSEYSNLSQLPPNSVVGTSSLRRQAFINKHYPHLKIKDVRGNLNTRFSKLYSHTKMYDALILAAAGIKRMGVEDKIGQFMEGYPYAVGQGVIAVQTRKDDVFMIEMLRSLNCRTAVLESLAERVFLSKLKAGCSAPVGVFCKAGTDSLTLTGVITSLDGSVEVSDSGEVRFDDNCGDDVNFTFIANLCDVGEMRNVSLMASQLAERVLYLGGNDILANIQ